MSYRVKVTPTALADIKEIHRYIAEELLEPEYALQQYDHITAAILLLNDMPGRYPLVRFEPERSLGVHRMPVDHYSVFYVIGDDIVTIISVLYTASDVEKRLSRQ